MDNAALAQSFNKTSLALGDQGHRIVVRRARSLVEAGEVDSAVAFLDEAARLSSLSEARDLSKRLHAWQAAGGSHDALCAEPLWDAGTSHDTHTADLIVQATSGGLEGMFGELVAQRRAADAGEPLPAAQVPETATAHALGSIFTDEQRQPAAVVEAETKLQPRSLEIPESLDDATAAMNEAVKAIAQETPAPMAAPMLPTPPPAPERAVGDSSGPMEIPDLALQGVVREADDRGLPVTDGAFDMPNLPELHAPPSMPAPPAPAKADAGDGVMKVVVSILVVAAIGAAIWFFTK